MPVKGRAPTTARFVPTESTILRDGEKLIEGLDYTFNYDATNNIIRLTPLAGIWEPDRVYEIQLSNSEGIAIQAPNGTEVNDGDSFHDHRQRKQRRHV